MDNITLASTSPLYKKTGYIIGVRCYAVLTRRRLTQVKSETGRILEEIPLQKLIW